MWRTPAGRLLKGDWRDALFEAARNSEPARQTLLHMCADEIRLIIGKRLLNLCGKPEAAKTLLRLVGYVEVPDGEDKARDANMEGSKGKSADLPGA
jgi:hypothetical protein